MALLTQFHLCRISDGLRAQVELRGQLLPEPADIAVADQELRAPAILGLAPLSQREGRTSLAMSDGRAGRLHPELVDACRLSPPSFSFLRQTERPVVQLRGRRPNVPKTAEEEGGYKRLMLKARPEKRSREKARVRGRSFREDFI